MKKILSAAILLFILLNTNAQKYPGLALTPPMGWNSWNTFQVNINEDLVKRTADLMVSNGMKDAGYTYIVLDDGWMMKERDSITGDLVADPKKFPSGMESLVAYVHERGLKFGLYNCAGTKTCGGYPASRGYEYQDARLYAKFKIDYLKYDWCNTAGITAKEAYATMSNALKVAKQPIVFSLCEWGDNKPWEWATPVGHLWRTTGDITACFDCADTHGGAWTSWGVMKIVDMRKDIRKYAGPGHWNDPDMLEVGNGMTVSEDRTHFSIWCMQAAPLMAGNDIRKMSPQTREILTNKEVIAIDQDALGIQGFVHSSKDSVDTWYKPLQNGDWAVCFLNRSKTPKTINHNWKATVIYDSLSAKELNATTAVYNLRDLWAKKDLGNTDKPLQAEVGAHDVLVLRVSKGK